MNDFEINNNFRYKNIVVDVRYESEEKNHKNNIVLSENMEYIPGEDCYICKNNRRLNLENKFTRKTATGYQRKVSIYSCSDCSNCGLKRSCIKNSGS